MKHAVTHNDSNSEEPNTKEITNMLLNRERIITHLHVAHLHNI